MKQQAGYSKRKLVQKLGIKAGDRMIILNAPNNYDRILSPLPDQVDRKDKLNGTFDFIQYFTKSKSQLTEDLPGLKNHLVKNGMIWISWPKMASKVPTDMTEDEVRRAAFPMHLVDIKVCAVDEIWSGLKLVIRKEYR